MPIRAGSDQGDVHAFAMNAEQWQGLKARHKAKATNLWMPCCQVLAVPKTSPRGTFFFAHARRGECATADESPEHLYCKSLIAQAAMDAGWKVTSEWPGQSPEGEQWVADVFCEKGTAKLALEVQMSPQSDAETVRRQDRYRASGVRGAWFFGAGARRATLELDRATPVFNLRPVEVGTVPTVEPFGMSLTRFVEALLHRRIDWAIPIYERPHLVEYIDDACWACKMPVKQVLEHMEASSSPDDDALTESDFYEGRFVPTAYTVAAVSKRLEALHAVLSNDDLAAQGLNLVGRKDIIGGKPTRFPFVNLCLHCHAPQNNHFLCERVLDAMQRQSSVGADEELTELASAQSGPFGVALIPRVLRGRGVWKLQEADSP